MDTPHFENPPLVEVIIRLGLNRAWLNLRDLAGICALRTRFQERLPDARFLEDLHPLAAPFRPLPVEGLLSGIRFSGGAEGMTVTVLPQQILVQWENRDPLSSRSYPRFEALKDLIGWAVDAAQSALGRDSFPGFKMANMTYTNFIPVGERPRWRDVRRYFRSEVIPQQLDDSGLCNEVNLAWRTEDGRDHRFLVRALSLGQDLPQGIEFVASAGRFLEPAVDWPEEDLLANHKALGLLFGRVTTPEAYREWSRFDA